MPALKILLQNNVCAVCGAGATEVTADSIELEPTCADWERFLIADLKFGCAEHRPAKGKVIPLEKNACPSI
jgi:hypothetical protein